MIDSTKSTNVAAGISGSGQKPQQRSRWTLSELAGEAAYRNGTSQGSAVQYLLWLAEQQELPLYIGLPAEESEEMKGFVVHCPGRGDEPGRSYPLSDKAGKAAFARIIGPRDLASADLAPDTPRQVSQIAIDHRFPVFDGGLPPGVVLPVGPAKGVEKRPPTTWIVFRDDLERLGVTFEASGGEPKNAPSSDVGTVKRLLYAAATAVALAWVESQGNPAAYTRGAKLNKRAAASKALAFECTPDAPNSTIKKIFTAGEKVLFGKPLSPGDLKSGTDQAVLVLKVFSFELWSLSLPAAAPEAAKKIALLLSERHGFAVYNGEALLVETICDVLPQSA
jgi:hypothetical protein